jgi:hypothetical protein
VEFVPTLNLGGKNAKLRRTKSFLDQRNITVLDEWNLEKMIQAADDNCKEDYILMQIEKTDINHSPLDAVQHSMLRVSVSFSRRWGFYAWNVFCILVRPYPDYPHGAIQRHNVILRLFAVSDRWHNFHDWGAR